jgi:hypothetical protein
MGAEKKDVERGELPFSPHGFTNANPVPKGKRQDPPVQQAQHDRQNGLEIWCAIIGGHSGIGSAEGGVTTLLKSGFRKNFSWASVPGRAGEGEGAARSAKLKWGRGTLKS